MTSIVITMFIVASIMIALAVMFGDGKTLFWGCVVAGIGLILSYVDAAVQAGVL